MSVNTTGQAPKVDLTYARPVTGISAITPANASTTAGTAVTYGVTVTDGYSSAAGNAAGLEIFPNGAGTGATCSATSCEATKAGTYQVTATSNGFQKTTTLTVEAGPLAATSLNPATGTVAAGTDVPFTVSGDRRVRQLRERPRRLQHRPGHPGRRRRVRHLPGADLHRRPGR